ETNLDQIDPETVELVTDRTEGWAASLQLVIAALHDRSRTEARQFVAGLTGARGVVYDYLAEEVIGHLSGELQRFLMRTSVLGAIDVETATLVSGLTQKQVEGALNAVESIGLLARRGSQIRDAHGYHPLVREFLQARLKAEEGHEEFV